MAWTASACQRSNSEMGNAGDGSDDDWGVGSSGNDEEDDNGDEGDGDFG